MNEVEHLQQFFDWMVTQGYRPVAVSNALCELKRLKKVEQASKNLMLKIFSTDVYNVKAPISKEFDALYSELADYYGDDYWASKEREKANA